MVTLLLDSATLDIELSGAERLLTLGRSNVRVPRAAITKVQLTDDPWLWLRGHRDAGTAVRGVVAAGIWRRGREREFVLVRRHKPGVVIDIAPGEEFSRILLTIRHGRELAQAFTVEVSTDSGLIDIVDLAP